MLLHYEDDFCVQHDVMPFSPSYFAVPHQLNPALQLQQFIDVSAYLSKKAGRSFAVDRYDDPGTSVNKLMVELSDAGFVADFPPTRLRQPYGEPVCRVLNFLSDLALQAQGFRWKRPQYPKEECVRTSRLVLIILTLCLPSHSLSDCVFLDRLAEEAQGDDSAMLGDDDEVEDEAIVADDDEDVLYSEPASQVPGGAAAAAAAPVAAAEPPPVDATEWHTEVERVAPRLRASKTASGKEWRAHLEQAQNHKRTLESLFPAARSALERMEAELADLLQRVNAKEKFLNSTFRNLREEYQQTHSRLEDATQSHQEMSRQVSELSNEVSAATEQLEDIAAQMKERGSSMTDTAPLVRIKGALTKLRTEMKSMDLRIGVVGHTLMQSKMVRDRASAGPAEAEAEGDDDGLELSGDEGDEEDDFAPINIGGNMAGVL